MLELSTEYLAKAEESLAGAESEHAAGRYSNCANRCYYAAFQAAIAALIRAGVTPRGSRAEWGHEFVQAAFSQLVSRRKLYSSELRGTLSQLMTVRLKADYEPRAVSAREATRATREAWSLVVAVREAR